MAQTHHFQGFGLEPVADGLFPEEAGDHRMGIEEIQGDDFPYPGNLHLVHFAHAAAAEKTANDVPADPFHSSSLRACCSGIPAAMILAAAARAS